MCVSQGAAACLGLRHAGCLQVSHRRPPEMCGLRPRRNNMPPSNCHRRGGISSRRPRGDNLFIYIYFSIIDTGFHYRDNLSTPMNLKLIRCWHSARRTAFCRTWRLARWTAARWRCPATSTQLSTTSDWRRLTARCALPTRSRTSPTSCSARSSAPDGSHGSV